uniref:DMSO reductase anchor subunit (DmsC) n=1 Tax=Magnetococcus massalia (strain MO-1) TaxID=451514 RepID=A0A1S7LEI0_MAGMO|nr:DMSO reductase anchor subunit (DmsC) [Candidatus Magnetococcus massalia]
MKPAYSVVFLTTLIGAGQGLATSVVASQTFAKATGIELSSQGYYAIASVAAFALLAMGLIAAFFHLTHPFRGWRAVTRWRTSWLSKEVILLPMVMGLVFLYTAAHYLGFDPKLSFGFGGIELSLLLGWAILLLSTLLFVATGMIYASVKFIPAWHSAYTVFNFTLLGLTSGFTAGLAYAYTTGNERVISFNLALTVLITFAAMTVKFFSVLRNNNLLEKFPGLQSAIGYHHRNLRQETMGFMGGSYNTKEYFHGKDPFTVLAVKWLGLSLIFPGALVFVMVGATMNNMELVLWAFALQMLGLFMERWAFLAEGEHIQNVYYQNVA